MANLLSDPRWQFIGVAIAFLSLWIPIIVYVMENRRGSLGYTVVLNFMSPIDLNSKNSKNYYVTIIKLHNNGRIPIKADDFEEPVFFKAQNNKIMDVEVIESQPSYLKPSVKVKLGGFILAPILLNPNDSMLIKVVSTNKILQLENATRIVGVKEIKKLPNESTRIYKFSTMLIYVGLLLIGPMLTAVALHKTTPDFGILFIGPGGLLMLTGEMLIVFRAIYSRYKVRRDKLIYTLDNQRKKKKSSKR